MAIITFKSNQRKETGQTMSIASIGANMAIERNFRILVISTAFRETTLENSFLADDTKTSKKINKDSKAVGLQSGIEGLVKVITINKTNPEVIRNYSKVILKDRLDVLQSCIYEEYEEYVEISQNYDEVIKMADKYYDMVLVDLSRNLPEEVREKIIGISNIIVENITQSLKSIDDFIALKEENPLYRQKNILLIIGRYDGFSKYNIKNVTRYMKDSKSIGIVPYNTLLAEACMESQMIDFFLRVRNVNKEDRNFQFTNQVSHIVDLIFIKIEELKRRV